MKRFYVCLFFLIQSLCAHWYRINNRFILCAPDPFLLYYNDHTRRFVIEHRGVQKTPKSVDNFLYNVSKLNLETFLLRGCIQVLYEAPYSFHLLVIEDIYTPPVRTFHSYN